jgi:hypothetical protein
VQVFTDNLHMQDPIGPNNTTREAMSQAVKILKQRLLKRILDTYNMDQCLIFCRYALSYWLYIFTLISCSMASTAAM